MTNEIGKVVQSGFKTIEAARKAANDNVGYEAITKDKDGNYAIRELNMETQQHEAAINLINSMNTGSSDEVVELFIDYMPDKSFRKEASGAGHDSIGIGAKIQDRYIDNFKENKFKDIKDADKAAGRHQGIEAIVKNDDGSYSLYAMSPNDVEKILANREKYPNIERINFPYSFYGSSVNSIYDAINIHEVDKKGNYRHNFENFQERLNRNDYAVLGWMHLTPEHLKADHTGQYQEFISSIPGLSAKVTALREMEEANQTFRNIKEGAYVDIEELNRLGQNLNNVISQAESGAISLDPKSLGDLKAMVVSLEKVKETETKLIAARKEFHQTTDEAVKNVHELEGKIQDLKKQTFLTTGERKLLSTLETILGNYVKIANTGNRENIALYSVFMKSVMNYLSTPGRPQIK